MIKKSTTKLAALFVALCMALTLMPFAAFAAEETSKTGSESSDPVETSTADTTDGSEAPGESGQTKPPATETDAAEPSATVVTITIAAGENGDVLYLDAGIPVTDAMLLADVSAADESGEAVAVTVAEVGAGLTVRTRSQRASSAAPKPTRLHTRRGTPRPRGKRRR